MMEAKLMDPALRDLLPTDLMQALRGIWKVEEQMVGVEVDQDRQTLIACAYEGDPLDPRPVIREGVQVKAFEAQRNGRTYA